MSTKRSRMLKQTCSWTYSWKLQDSLSMRDLLVYTRNKELKILLKTKNCYLLKKGITRGLWLSPIKIVFWILL